MPALIHTRGIVFHHVKFGETSIVARIYTEKAGLQSYMIKGIRNKRSRIPYSLFQSGMMLEMVAYKNEKHTLQHIRDTRCEYMYTSVLNDIRKSAVLLFMMDVLNRTIHEEEANQELFDFIHFSLVNLDKITRSVSNYHLVFLVQLARFLGFSPRNNYSEHDPYFNMSEGEFCCSRENPGLYMEPPLTRIISDILQMDYAKLDKLTLTPSTRNEVLDGILSYYGVHSPFIRDIQSHLILREAFS
ncbi:MAG: DNA repair protein RecO [Bacteroidales bacterium]|nr:DNA repair protein RecO [Lentimicrobiaceae bacterium]MDD5694425.1 DNA repair protein RecO [Bacteroidales bacterium]